MADAPKLVNITVNGKQITAAQGTLLIEACKQVGIEVPSFCYYPGLSLQGACRMCLVEIEKMPKLQTACTTPIAEGMVVQTESEKVVQARKSMLELLLANHPLDCPVCDAGGQCELQDMTFTYGAAESKFIDIKSHRDEQQWSPVVYFDRPRCILCYRCVRVCGEGMDVWALGIQNRGQGSVIAPNKQDHLECEECGMCIDICPVGALTSGAYRYKTRPWEMNHVSTVCTHCGDGCITTLGVRRHESGTEIVRGDNRDKSGVNGDFLCIKGRYAFDFTQREDRIKQPLVKRDGKFVPVTWAEAIEMVAVKFQQVVAEHGPQAIGVIGSNRTTNEESYLLQKFARLALKTNNIDHHRTADFPAFAGAIAETKAQTASMADVFNAPAILLIGNNPTDQHPLLAWQIRNNVRLHRARLYLVNSTDIKLRRQAVQRVIVPEGTEPALVRYLAGDDGFAQALTSGDLKTENLTALRDALRAEQNLVVIFGSELRGGDVSTLVKWGAAQGAKFICLGDYANSRGAADMGLYPDLLPGYVPVAASTKFHDEWSADVPAMVGMGIAEMMSAAKSGALKALYVVGSNPVSRYEVDPFALNAPFVVVQDMFMTETALAADVVLPVASAYEKQGTFTNTCGDLQMVKKAGDVSGVKTDFEIIVRLAEKMGFPVRRLVPYGGAVHADLGQSRGAQMGEADRHAVWLESRNMEPRVSPLDPMAMLDELQRLVPGYDISRLNLMSGGYEHTELVQITPANIPSHPEMIVPSNDTLFTSGTLGRFSRVLNSVIESERKTPADKEVAAD
ncbi:MAG TPA: NADH-quinone oxidoreductase subunit NuoG [Clostridia bacterium]|nr:NADH-quinone oxidoreductase subunit NuoG [Clostridia bacterium]